MTRWNLALVTVGFAGLVGVALADPPENPFGGSWAGIYEFPEGGGGTVEFRVSKTGVLEGRSINEDGTGHTLIGRVNADGWMIGVAIFENGGPAEFYSGSCSIKEDGSMVCDVIGCIQNDCFEFTVTVGPVTDSDGTASPTSQASAARPTGACVEGSYVGAASGGGVLGGAGSQKAAKQDASLRAEHECAEHCAGLDACPASKPTCQGSASVRGLTCELSTAPIGGGWFCWGEYRCTCGCAGNK
jgi:hypothetical protein